MANSVEPLIINPKNSSVEIATDDTSASLRLNIGTSGDDDAYYDGIFWKKPDSTTIGIDCQPYVKDLPEWNGNIQTVTAWAELTNFFRAIVIKLKTMAGSTVYNFSCFVSFQSFRFKDWLKVKAGLAPFNFHLWATQEKEWLTNGAMALGQANEPNWTDKVLGNVTESAYPLQQAYCEIFNTLSGDFRTEASYYFETKIYGNVTIEFEAKHANMGGTWILKVNGETKSDTFTTSFQKYTYTFVASGLLSNAALAFELGRFETGRLHLKNIRIYGGQYDWRLTGIATDWLLHNGIYTFGERIWNRALKGAPIKLYLANEKATTEAIVATWSDYADKSADMGSVNAITSQTMGARKAYAVMLPAAAQENSLVSINLEPAEHYPEVRQVYFEIIDPANCPREMYQLYYLNRLGGIDFLPMEGKNYRSKEVTKKAIQLEQRIYTSGAFSGDTDRHTKEQYLSESEQSLEINSLNMDAATYQRHEDIIDSPKVWLWSDREQLLYAVEVTDTNYKYKTYTNDNVFNFAARVKIMAKDNWQ